MCEAGLVAESSWALALSSDLLLGISEAPIMFFQMESFHVRSLIQHLKCDETLTRLSDTHLCSCPIVKSSMVACHDNFMDTAFLCKCRR